MLYFGKPPVQVFMAEIDGEAASDVEGRYRKKRRKKKEKGPYTGANYFWKDSLEQKSKNQKIKKNKKTKKQKNKKKQTKKTKKSEKSKIKKEKK